MRNQIRSILLLGVLSALLVGVGGWLGPGALWISIALAAVLNLGAYFFSDRIVLRLHGARDVSPAQAPGLHAMVEELAARAGIPKPRVCVIPGDQPNAFATGRNPRRGVVAVTEGIVSLLSHRELRGVLAHEIAHIRNRDILVATIASMMAAAIGHAANLFSFAFLLGSQDEEEGAGGGFLAMLIAPLAATLVQLGVSRSREFMADETGARLSGDPEALASALEKLEWAAARVPPATEEPATASLFIVNPLAGAETFSRLFSTHPPTAERVRRLRGMFLGRVA